MRNERRNIFKPAMAKSKPRSLFRLAIALPRKRENAWPRQTDNCDSLWMHFTPMNKGRARSMPHLILGLDCGGTKTAAALAIVSDARSEEVHFDILGKGVAGPSNPCSVGEEHAYENVVTAIRDAFRHAALPAQSVASMSVCMRHASTDAQARDMVQQAAESLSLLVRLALQRTGAHDPSYLLAVSGGLLEIESLLLQDLRQSLATHRCAPGHIHLVQYPAHGALFMAAQALKSTNA